MRRSALALSLLAGVMGSEAGAQAFPGQASPQPTPTQGIVRAETIAEGFNHPWGLAFLPDGRIMVTERSGEMRIVSRDGQKSAPLTGVPAVVARGQGGLLDIAVDPDFQRNRTIFFSYSEPGEGNTAGTSVARARLAAGDAGLEDVRVIYQQQPKLPGAGHFGSRIVFNRDGTLWVTQGDRQSPSNRQGVQDLTKLQGKIVRINKDGTVPKDNPFVGRADARPEIWSYGHRNVQAAAIHPETGELWSVEHGPRGGDELNNPKPGKNYGWPIICYCVDYSGQKMAENEGTAKEGLEQPVYYWDPVIAPSGMAFYTGDRYPGWKGSLLIGSMGTLSMVRLTMVNGRVTSEQRFLSGVGRVRDIQQGPDGLLYLVTDADNGKLVRVVPAN